MDHVGEPATGSSLGSKTTLATMNWKSLLECAGLRQQDEPKAWPVRKGTYPMATDLIHLTMAVTFLGVWALIGHLAVVHRRL